MKGKSEYPELNNVLTQGSLSVLLFELKKQLQMDKKNGLVFSTLSATKIAEEHIEGFIDTGDLDSQMINKLCRYYYGLGDVVL